MMMMSQTIPMSNAVHSASGVRKYSIEFPPGAMGLELEPVLISSERQIGCRISDFYFGLDHDGIDPKDIEGKIQVGDIMWFIGTENVLSSKFEDILRILRDKRNSSRRVVFKSFASNNAGSAVMSPQRDVQEAVVVSSHPSRDKENLTGYTRTTSPVKDSKPTSPRSDKFAVPKPPPLQDRSKLAYRVNLKGPPMETSGFNRFVDKALSPAKATADGAVSDVSAKKRKQHDDPVAPSQKVLVGSSGRGGERGGEVEDRMLSPKAVRSMSRLAKEDPPSPSSALIVSSDTLAMDVSMITPKPRRRNRSLLPSLPPELLRLLGTVGESIGISLLEVGKDVGIGATHAALAVGSAVGDQAERLVGRASQAVPKYSETEVREIMERKNVLLSELSQTSMLLGMAQDRQNNLELEASELRQKEQYLGDKLRVEEQQLLDLTAEVASLRMEKLQQQQHFEIIINDGRSEVDEWKRIAEEHKDRCARLLLHMQSSEEAVESSRAELGRERLFFSQAQEAWNQQLSRIMEEQSSVKADMDAAVNSVIAKMRTAELEREQAQADLLELKSLLKTTRSDYEGREHQIKELLKSQSEELNHRDLELRSVREALRESQIQQTLSQESVAHLRNELVRQRENTVAVEQAFESSSGLVSSLQQQLSDAREGLSGALSEVDTFRMASSTATSRLLEFEALAVSHVSEMQSLQQETTSLQSTVTALKGKLAAAQQQNSELGVVCEGLRVQETQSAQRIGDLERAQVDLTDRHVSLAAELAVVRAELLQSRGDCVESSSACSVLQQKCTQLEGDQLCLINELEQARQLIRELCSREVQLQSEVLELANRNLEVTGQVEVANKSLTQLTADLLAVRRESDDLAKLQLDVASALDESQQQRVALSASHASLQAHRDDLEGQVSRLRMLVSRLGRNVLTAVASLKREVKDVKAAYSESLDQLASINRAKSQSDAALRRSLCSEVSELKARRAELETAVQRACQRADLAELNTIETEKRCLESLERAKLSESKVIDLLDQINAYKASDLDGQLASWMQKAQSSLEASNELKHAADGLQSTLAATQLALDHCRRELSDKEVLLEEAQKGNQIKGSLEQALESLRLEVQRYASLAEEACSRETRLEGLVMQSEEERMHYIRHVEVKMDAAPAPSTVDVSVITQDMQRAVDELALCRASVATFRLENTALRTAKAEVDREMVKLKREIETTLQASLSEMKFEQERNSITASHFDSERQLHKQQLLHLEQQLEASAAENSRLVDSARQTDSTLSSFKRIQKTREIELNKEISSLSEVLNIERNSREALEQIHRQEQVAMAALQISFDSLQTSFNSLEDRYRDVSLEAASLGREVLLLRESEGRSQAIIAAGLEEVAGWKKQVESLHAAREAIASQILDAEARNKLLVEEKSAVEELLSSKQVEFVEATSKHQSDLLAAQTRATQLELELTYSKDDIDFRSADSQRKLKEERDLSAKILQEKETVEKKLMKSQLDAATANETAISLISDNNAQREKIRILEQDLEAVRSACEKYRVDSEVQFESATALSAEMDTLQSKLASLHTHAEALSRREKDMMEVIKIQTDALEAAELREREHGSNRMQLEALLAASESHYRDIITKALNSERLAVTRATDVEQQVSLLRAEKLESDKLIDKLSRTLSRKRAELDALAEQTSELLASATTPQKASRRVHVSSFESRLGVHQPIGGADVSISLENTGTQPLFEKIRELLSHGCQADATTVASVLEALSADQSRMRTLDAETQSLRDELAAVRRQRLWGPRVLLALLLAAWRTSKSRGVCGTYLAHDAVVGASLPVDQSLELSQTVDYDFWNLSSEDGESS